MLMNHKNFHFTQIWDKTNDMIFLKSPKTLFWGHFWPCSVSEKTNEPILRKLMDRQKDGQTNERMDGWMDRRIDGWLFL